MHFTVYRIEHLDGIGIFRQRDKDQNFREHNIIDIYLSADSRSEIFKYVVRSHDHFNTPGEDGLDLYKDDKEWFCAYKTISDIRALISKPALDELLKMNYSVYQLLVSEYQIGRDQIIFTEQGVISKVDVTEKLKFRY